MKEVRVPKIDYTQSDVTLVRWLKNPGDAVRAGNAIAEVENEKAIRQIKAEASGVLGNHLVEAGDEVPVNTLLTTIE